MPDSVMIHIKQQNGGVKTTPDRLFYYKTQGRMWEERGMEAGRGQKPYAAKF